MVRIMCDHLLVFVPGRFSLIYNHYLMGTGKEDQIWKTKVVSSAKQILGLMEGIWLWGGGGKGQRK